MSTLLIATGNRKKTLEFRALLAGSPVLLRDLSEFDVGEVEETGQTFEENARLKASSYARGSGLWSLADDSGLEVEALGGKPGVLSARWAAHHNRGQGDQANNALLVEQLAGVREENRAARFNCVLALADPSGKIVLIASDHVGGQILESPRGANGFGYDPLFFIQSSNKTMAELTSEEKQAISHRGKAMRKMVRLMREQKLLD